MTKLSLERKLIFRNSKKPTKKTMVAILTIANLTMALLFVILLALVCWALASRADWKKKAACGEGVFLAFYNYPLIGNMDSLQSVRVKAFPGTLEKARGHAHKFLDRNGYKQISTTSRVELFCRENEMVKMFFWRWGVISETILSLSE
ncbi:MAG: hypothetical protein AAB537_00130 [Patescibacteria group bacterium]